MEKRDNDVHLPNQTKDVADSQGQLGEILKNDETYSLFPKEIDQILTLAKNSDLYKRIMFQTMINQDDAEYEETCYVFDSEKNVWQKSDSHHYQARTTFDDAEEITEDELRDKFKNLSPQTEIRLQPAGTHVGSLKFELGRAHKNSKKEEAKEAFLPQTNR